MTEPPRPGDDPTAPPPPPDYGPPPGYNAPPPGGPPPGYNAPPPGGPPPGYNAPPPGGPPPGGPPPGYSAPPPGYGAPPPGGPPSGGFSANQFTAPGAPTPFTSQEDKTWAALAHFGGIVIGFFAPLITLLARGNVSPAVRAHSIEALNFQITWGLATIVATILATCTFGFLFFLPMITWLMVTVCSILAGIQALDGRLYHYPLTWRPVR